LNSGKNESHIFGLERSSQHVSGMGIIIKLEKLSITVNNNKMDC